MSFHLRPYQPQDFEPAMQVWVTSWQATYPEIDFSARLDWWKQRWLNELIPVGEIIVAADDDKNIVGFVVLTPATGYLDQLVVAPAWQGSNLAKSLLDYVKGRSEGTVELHVNQSNARALRFYEREGFTITHKAVNLYSGLPTYHMCWEQS